MTAYETVKYFNAEQYEFSRYRDIVDRYQEKEYILLRTLNTMNITQNMCFTVGLMAACFLAAFQISIGQIGVGKFVALLTYMGQLQAPLNYFGEFLSYSRSSQAFLTVPGLRDLGFARGGYDLMR